MIVKSFVGAALLGLLLAHPCSAQTAAELLQKGIYTQDAVGDVDDAIRIFRQVLTTPSPKRDYAAQAQSRIVLCLLKKGDAASAGREFDKLARDYTDFKDLVSSIAGQVRGLTPQRDRVQLRNGPTRILSAIQGTVTDDTGRPLRRAQIRLSAPELRSEARTVSTDEAGHYEVTALPAANYNLLVTRSGYLPLRYGQRRPREQGKPLQILDGEVLENVDFMLPRMALITGRIADETGEPIANVLVFAERSLYFDGRRQMVPAGQAPLVQTDDDGEYRLVGLVPGTYVVRAQTREKWTIDEGSREEVMGYAPTYFPGTSNITNARTITVGVGQEANNTDFALIPGRAASISGTAFDSRGRPFRNVNLAQEIRGEGFGSFGMIARATIGDDGRFTFSNIPPGQYKLEASTLQAAGVTDGAPEMAILPIDVSGSDIEHVVLTGSGGGSIRGQVVADTGTLPKTEGIRIILAQRLLGQPEPLRMGTFGAANGFGRADLNADGTFSLDHVLGPARFNVTVPDGWAVKAVVHDGRDITDAPIDLKNAEQLADVQIVLTRRVTTLSGQVTDDKGSATPDGTVIVFAADRSKWFEDSRFVRAARPDQKGRYQLMGLPPGDYLAAAVDYVQQGEWADPDYLDALRQYARTLTLAEGETQTIPLALVRP
jgi:protocatechuate 3,4-dioxygenase beta subunit